MASDFNRDIRSLCLPDVQQLYEQFDKACAANDYDKADAILLQISDINAGDTAFPPNVSTTRH